MLARSEQTARYVQKHGVKSERLTVTGPFLEEAVTLPYNSSDREELAGLLRGRPIWLAASKNRVRFSLITSAPKVGVARSYRLIPHLSAVCLNQDLVS